jgi:hypothetical protein
MTRRRDRATDPEDHPGDRAVKTGGHTGSVDAASSSTAMMPMNCSALSASTAESAGVEGLFAALPPPRR